MIQNLYSIFDKQANEYLPPFIAKNVNIAMRMCNNIIETQKNILEDLQLWYIGTFDNETGSLDTNTSFISGLAYIEKSNTEEYVKI